MTKEEKILSLQCESTRRALKRPIEEDMQWSKRPVPENWLAVPDAITWEERVGCRPLSYKEVSTEETLRRARGKYIAEIRNETDIKKIDPEKKERAINAFMSIFGREKVKDMFKQIMSLCGLAEKVK